MIASWNCQHREQTVAAFEAGKHVFCQKPLALTVGECVEMLDAWKKSGKMFNIGFTLRYSPHYRKINEIIASGKIGQVISMEFNETLEFNHGGYIMGDWSRLIKNAGSHLPKNVHRMAKSGKSKYGETAHMAWKAPDESNPFTCDKDITPRLCRSARR